MLNQSLNALTTIITLTLRESQRRRILWALLVMGLGFLGLFGTGFHYMWVDVQVMAAEQQLFPIFFLTLAGLYVTHFLVILIAVLISVAGVSAEIENHTLDVLITKPLFRWQVVLGKWLAYALLILGCVLLLPGGVLLLAYLRAGFVLANGPAGLALIYLSGLLMMSVAVLGGTRFSTLANGALTFMLYGIAFVGGWVEQIGALLRNEAAVNIGIISSLILPVDILWRRASYLLTPPAILQLSRATGPTTPFFSTAQPSERMLWYAGLYLLVLLGLALWSISRRDV
ncbi:MAG: ABC transporter permease [Anaerolineales bacterium]|nr:ABC transporter permease [Anaerolineales bacterium]